MSSLYEESFIAFDQNLTSLHPIWNPVPYLWLPMSYICIALTLYCCINTLMSFYFFPPVWKLTFMFATELMHTQHRSRQLNSYQPIRSTVHAHTSKINAMSNHNRVTVISCLPKRFNHIYKWRQQETKDMKEHQLTTQQHVAWSTQLSKEREWKKVATENRVNINRIDVSICAGSRTKQDKKLGKKAKITWKVLGSVRNNNENSITN